MKPEELEELYIRSLDTTLTPIEKDLLRNGMATHPGLATLLHQHQDVRQKMRAPSRATFGTSFADKVTQTIADSNIVVERLVFTIFKKYQLVAAGILVALLILNVSVMENFSLPVLFGLESDVAADSTDTLILDLYTNITSDL